MTTLTQMTDFVLGFHNLEGKKSSRFYEGGEWSIEAWVEKTPWDTIWIRGRIGIREYRDGVEGYLSRPFSFGEEFLNGLRNESPTGHRWFVSRRLKCMMDRIVGIEVDFLKIVKEDWCGEPIA